MYGGCDGGCAVPELYETCEELRLFYAIGYAANAVLKQRTQLTLNYAQALFDLWDEKQLHFQDIRDYQAESWDHPRRVIAKVEVMPQGSNRRFVVTNMTGVTPREIYHGFYVQRGDVPERPIRELKHGLKMDRLSAHRFFANSFTLLCHMLAYAIVVLFREANEPTGTGGCHGGSGDAPRAGLQSGGGGEDQRAADLVPCQCQLAAAEPAGADQREHRAVPRGGAPCPPCLRLCSCSAEWCCCHALLIRI